MIEPHFAVFFTFVETRRKHFQMTKNLSFPLFFLAIFLFACTSSKPFFKNIEKYRAEKITENTTGDRHPLQPGDEKDLRFFAIDRKFQVKAKFTAATDTAVFDMLTYSGKTRKYFKFGDLHFRLAGKKLRLSLYRNVALISQEKYKNHLFLPFKDLTNGEETYGGGRYLDFETTDLKNGKLVLDFNKSYNPWCAYSDGFNCPIPPAENHLDASVFAGEKNFAGEKKHPK